MVPVKLMILWTLGKEGTGQFELGNIYFQGFVDCLPFTWAKRSVHVFCNWQTKFGTYKLARKSPFAQICLIYQKNGLKSLKMNQRRFEETEPEYPFGTFPLGIIRVLCDCTVQYGSGSLSAMWEDVDVVVSLDFSLFSALSHLICLHSQRHIRFPLALSSQPASDVYGQKLWFVMSGCFSAGLWGLTCRHSCGEAVFCLLGEFPETVRHKEGSFGIRSSSIRTTWPGKCICQCFNS